MGGGGSSQPKNTTTTTTTAPPSWAVPYYQQLLSRSQQLSNQPYTPYTGQLVAGQTPSQQNAEWITSAGMGGTLPSQLQQQSALNGVLGGNYSVTPQSNPYIGAQTQVGTNAYAGSNPYLQGMINQSANDITKQYTDATAPALAAQFAQGGAFGGSAYNQQVSNQQQDLLKQLSNNENQYRFQDYTTQQGLAEDALNRSVQAQQTDLSRNSGLYQQGIQNQLQAAQQNAGNILAASQGITGANALQSQFAGQYLGIANNEQQTNQANLDAAYNQWYQQNYGYPQQQLATLGNGLNSISGNFQSGTQTGTNPAYVGQSTGGALTAAGGGALAGSAFGPWGTAIGAGAGLLSYYL